MPIKWTISHDDKIVEFHVLPEVELDEIRACFVGLMAANAVPYRKLIDLSFASLTHGAAGIKLVGERMREIAKTMPVGPVAVVVASELAVDLVEEFNRQGSLKRPLKVFYDTKLARAWLMEQPTGQLDP